MYFHNTCRSFPVAVNFHHCMLLQCCNSIPQPQPSTDCLFNFRGYAVSPLHAGSQITSEIAIPWGSSDFATQSVCRTLVSTESSTKQSWCVCSHGYSTAYHPASCASVHIRSISAPVPCEITTIELPEIASTRQPWRSGRASDDR